VNEPLKLLFICSRNRIRSLTAERLFSSIPGFEVRSAGTQPGARIVVTPGHLGWADYIFVMEKAHLRRLQERFPEEIHGKQVVTLHIPDDYVLNQPELRDELWSRVASVVKMPTPSV